MADHYPYQQPFENFLIQQGLAPLTVATYATSLTSFFDFLRANRPAFAHDPPGGRGHRNRRPGLF